MGQLLVKGTALMRYLKRKAELVCILLIYPAVGHDDKLRIIVLIVLDRLI